MPVHHNDQLDDLMAFDHQSSFSGGQLSYARANLLSENQGTAIFDCDQESNLVIGNRRGFRRLGQLGALIEQLFPGQTLKPQGLWWFETPEYRLLLALAGGELFRCSDDHEWEHAGSGAVTDAELAAHAAQVVNMFYVTTGEARGTAWDGARLAGGPGFFGQIQDGPAKLSLLASARFRLWGLNGETSDEVWCSKYLPADASPFTVGGTEILPFRVGEGDGDPVKALTQWKGLFGIVTLKARSVHLVEASSAAPTSAATTTSAFGIQHMSSQVGCVASRSVVRTGNDILFLADDGIRSVRRTMDDGDGELSEPLSLPIHNIIERINPAARHLSCAEFWDGRYVCAVPLDESPVPDTVLVFMPKIGAWMVWTGLQPIAWAIANWAGQPSRLMCFDARGEVLEFRGHVPPSSAATTDYRDNIDGNDVRIPWFIRTRAFTWGDQVSPKQIDHAEFEFDKSEAIINIDVILDNDASGVRLTTKERTGFGGLPLPFVLPARLGDLKVRRINKSMLHYANAREVMFEIRESAELTSEEQSESGVLRLRSVQAGAYLETLEEEE